MQGGFVHKLAFIKSRPLFAGNDDCRRKIKEVKFDFCMVSKTHNAKMLKFPAMSRGWKGWGFN